MSVAIDPCKCTWIYVSWKAFFLPEWEMWNKYSGLFLKYWHYSFLALICYSLDSLRRLTLKHLKEEKSQIHSILLNLNAVVLPQAWSTMSAHCFHTLIQKNYKNKRSSLCSGLQFVAFLKPDCLRKQKHMRMSPLSNMAPERSFMS